MEIEDLKCCGNCKHDDATCGVCLQKDKEAPFDVKAYEKCSNWEWDEMLLKDRSNWLR